MASSSFQGFRTCMDTSSEKCRLRATRFPLDTLGKQHTMPRKDMHVPAVAEALSIASNIAKLPTYLPASPDEPAAEALTWATSCISMESPSETSRRALQPHVGARGFWV